MLVLILAVLAAACAAQPTLVLNTTGSGGPGPFELNEPVYLDYDFGAFLPRQLTSNDGIVLFPHNASDDCIGNDTIFRECLTKYTAASYSKWTLSLPYPQRLTGKGTVVISQIGTAGNTPYVSRYTAFLVTQEVGFPSVYTSWAKLSFDVVSTNTLTIINPAPFATGVLVRYTAPRFHTVWDSIRLRKTNCTLGGECILSTSLVDAGTTGLVHLAINPAQQQGVDVFVDYEVCAGHLGLGVPRTISTTTAIKHVFDHIKGTCPSGCGIHADEICNFTDYSGPCLPCTGATACALPPCPIMKSMSGQLRKARIVRSYGETVFDTQFRITNAFGQVTIYPESMPAATAGAWSFEQDNVDPTLWTFRWTSSTVLTPGTRTLSWYAIDEHGRLCAGERFIWTLFIKDNICRSQGDPHFKTFDGMFYDFQGVGEFVLFRALPGAAGLSVARKNFVVQVRQEWCWNGRLPHRATCTTGVAVSTPAGYLSIVSTYSNETQTTSYDTLLNGVPLNLVVGAAATTLTGAGSIKRSANSLFLMDFQSVLGISVLFEAVRPNVFITVDELWVNKTLGLCGDFDGDENDDLRLLNGTLAGDGSSTTSETIYHNFGLEWRVAKVDTLFNYTAPRTYEEVNALPPAPPAFEPVYDSPEAEVEANSLCGNLPGASQEEVQQCRFDVAFGGPSVAYTYVELVYERCLYDTDPDLCANASSCPGNACNLRGQCIFADGNFTCHCDPGYLPPDCLPAPSSSASKGTDSLPKHSSNEELDVATEIAPLVAVLLGAAAVVLF